MLMQLLHGMSSLYTIMCGCLTGGVIARQSESDDPAHWTYWGTDAQGSWLHTCHSDI